MDHQSFTGSAENASDAAHALLFSALLRPHRSLTAQRLIHIIMGIALCGCVLAIPFVIMGYWPVAGFYGLDIALLYWALRHNMRDARAYEEIRLSAVQLWIRKVNAHGEESSWFFTPLWTRLEQDRGTDQEIRHLRLICRGVSLQIADCLSPEDREDFSQCFNAALREARKGPIFQNPF